MWRTGEVIDGRYEVVDLTGRGAMGEVYQVRHRQWNIDLAAKIPRGRRAQPAGTPAVRRRGTDLGLSGATPECLLLSFRPSDRRSSGDVRGIRPQ